MSESNMPDMKGREMQSMLEALCAGGAARVRR